MTWKQVKPFNPSKGGTKSGYCLQNVRLGFGVAPLYDDAWTAWNNTEQHPNRITPENVDVPLYYDYTDSDGNRYGHINVRLADGRVWNDGRLHPSLPAFEKTWANVKYVGWGESVNGVRVIEKGAVMPSAQDVKDYFKKWEKRTPTAREVKDYTSKTWRYLTDKILDAQSKRNAKEFKKLKAENDLLKARLGENGDASKIAQIKAILGFK